MNMIKYLFNFTEMETLEITLEAEECGSEEDCSIFPRIAEKLDYADFFRQHLLANRPCIMSSVFTDDWAARRDFITADNSPDLENIMNLLSQDYTVPVSDCSSRE